MSGFFGLWNKGTGAIPDGRIQPALSKLTIRKSELEKVWQDGNVAMAAVAMETPEESAITCQLYNDSAAELVIAGEFRIDNRGELIQKLSLPNESANWPDGRIISSAYRKWGVEFPRFIIGDFALIVWDNKEQKLFGARDPMGVKPFFYYHDKDQIVCSSAIEPILAMPAIPKGLNELKVGSFLVRDYSDKTSTFYKDVFRLPGTHALLATHNRFRKWIYWEPDFSLKLPCKTDVEFAEAFDEVFTEAVKSRVESSKNVGSTLSGGLDSSSVAATASELLEASGQKLHTFSAIFPQIAEVDPRIDERPFINEMVESFPFNAHLIEVDDHNPQRQEYWEGAEPILGINFYMDLAFGAAARDLDVGVLLTGHDGDSVVSHGYELFPFLLERGRMIKLLRESKAVARIAKRSLRSIAWQLAVVPLWESWYPRSELPVDSEYFEQMAINEDFAERIGLKDYLETKNAEQGRSVSDRRDHWEGLASGLFFHGNETLDLLLRPFGVEPRHPFLDRRLIEFCIALPPTQRFRQGFNRDIMRRAKNELLPRKICWRRGKGNLSASFLTNLVTKNRKALDKLDRDIQQYDAFIDVDAYRRVYRRYLENPLKTSAEAMTVQTVATFVKWREVQRTLSI